MGRNRGYLIKPQRRQQRCNVSWRMKANSTWKDLYLCRLLDYWLLFISRRREIIAFSSGPTKTHQTPVDVSNAVVTQRIPVRLNESQNQTESPEPGIVTERHEGGALIRLGRSYQRVGGASNPSSNDKINQSKEKNMKAVTLLPGIEMNAWENFGDTRLLIQSFPQHIRR